MRIELTVSKRAADIVIRIAYYFLHNTIINNANTLIFVTHKSELFPEIAL